MVGQDFRVTREGQPGSVPGLGHLDLATVLTGEKRLLAARGETIADGEPFTGYEMHVGITTGPASERPVVRFADGRLDGATSSDGRVAGCYIHGLFADDRQRAAWLSRLGATPAEFSYEGLVEETLDALAAHLERHVDVEALLTIAQ